MDKPHGYLSTACHHQACGSCRQTCKFCDASCTCSCHPGSGQDQPQPWVDQARGIAVALLAAICPADVPGELAQQIARRPDLFWLRGECAPDGTGKDGGRQ